MHAVFTIVQDAPVHHCVWPAHYGRFYAPAHTYVLHHPLPGESGGSGWLADAARELAGRDCEAPFQVIPVSARRRSTAWLRDTVQAFQRRGSRRRPHRERPER